MEYGTEFELEFMRRTLRLVHNYTGPSDATLLLNCLLGLLIVPKEKSINKIPEDAVSDLDRWGISPSSIERWGKIKGKDHPQNLRQLVWSMRNAVAHFRIEPQEKNRECIGFDFTDQSGFRASISLEELHCFVERLARHLEEQLAP